MFHNHFIRNRDFLGCQSLQRYANDIDPNSSIDVSSPFFDNQDFFFEKSFEYIAFFDHKAQSYENYSNFDSYALNLNELFTSFAIINHFVYKSRFFGCSEN